MKNQLYSIGELSKLKGISVKTLRFYDEIGVLKPSYVDPFTKYRYYNKVQFVYVDILKALKALRTGTKEMASLINKKEIYGVDSFLEEQKHKMIEEKEEYERIIELIEEIQNHRSESSKAIQTKEIYQKEIPQRLIVSKEVSQNIDESELDQVIQVLEKAIDKENYKHTYKYGYLFQKEEDLFYPKEYFIEVHSQNSSKLKMIPAGMYACISYSRDNADEQIKKMNDYLGGSNVNVAQVVQIELLEDIFKETSYFELQILLGE